ncbi:MAG: alpha-amylase family glycosyl hydrolase, partial [Anaerolineae bacterium]
MPQARLQDTAPREFHVSRKARDRYDLEKTLFSLSGNVLFANFHAARVFADKMNKKRDLANYPEKAVRAGQINAMGLIDEILHYVVGRYREDKKSEVMGEAREHLEEEMGAEAVDEMLRTFIEHFPPVAVYQRDMTVEEYLEGETQGIPNRDIALEELVLLWLANANPAYSPFMELFDDDRLDKQTAYPQAIDALHDFFEEQPHFGPDDKNLMDLLREPAIEEPHSLSGQLEYIRKRWGSFLGKYLYKLLSSLDFLAEEEKMFFGFGPGPARVHEFGDLEEEEERFSPDSDWMPRVVLLAKNVYVWLDQLSKEYERDVHRLDQVPDAELDKIARQGFTGLWLIGLWERGEASKRIKQMMGNPEAVASAYSLYDYVIAEDLG